jgi:hypothetical protein
VLHCPALGVQLDAVQALPSAQSASVAQLVRQPFVSHAYGAHVPDGGDPQDPIPLQVAAGVKVEPAHEAVWQVASFPTNPLHASAFLPSQARPTQTSAVPATHAARAPCGAPTTAVHVPEDPTPSQASHCPVQARSQQTPSTQASEPHSALVVHDVPGSFAHVPFLTVVAQELPGSHLPALQQTPSVQNAPAGQLDAAVQGEPRTGVEPVVQTPSLHSKPAVQSATEVHDELHCVGPHR